MGCDIHVAILKRNTETHELEELKLYTKEKDGNYCKALIGEDRNYTLFSKLAGVRGLEHAISYGYDGLIPGCPEEIVENYYDYCHTPRYFAWDALRMCAEKEGMTEFEEIKNYNIVERWLDELEAVLSAHWVWDTSEVYVQIYFDN